MANIEFKPFNKSYQTACVELFKSNLDGYFSPDEVLDFILFLENLTADQHYYVGLDGQDIVACGGWGENEKGYNLRWGMIDNQRHQKGLGSQLLEFRINKIYELYGGVNIYIKTSGKAHGFFEKFGFQVLEIIPDGIYEGIDEVQMVKPFT